MPRLIPGVHAGPPGARSAGLSPERDVEALSATGFRALSPWPWLRIALHGGVPAGRWVRLRYRAGLLGDPVRPVLRIERGDGADHVVLPGPVCGAAVWTGPLPADATGLLINPVAVPGPFAFALDAVEVVSRAELLASAFRRRPALTLTTLGQRLRGRRQRARHLVASILASTPFERYGAWAAEREGEPALDEPWHEEWAGPRLGLLVVPGAGRPEALARTLASLERQRPGPWRAWIVSDAALDPASAAYLEAAAALCPRLAASPVLTGDVAVLSADLDAVGVLATGDELAPAALAVVAAAFARHPEADVIYGDEDGVDALGRRVEPRLKPGWSPRLQAGAPYLGAAVFVRASVPSDLAPVPASGLGAALLRTALACEAPVVRHVRRVLLRRALPAGLAQPNPLPHAEVLGNAEPRSTPDRGACFEAGLRPAPQHEEVGGSSFSQTLEPASQTRRSTSSANLPIVSVIVPSRDRLELLRVCVDGLLRGTAYPHVEIVIADNGSRRPETRDYYRSLAGEPRLRILDLPGPFNFSGLCNAGVAASRGEVVVLLNNDIEITAPGWLRRLVEELGPRDVGAVGPKLLYPDGRVQHAGVVVGLGGAAGHIYRARPDLGDGWMGCLTAPHEVSAVTGACLALRRAAYDAVGGLDETAFPISFNDIDLCLKLRARGWRNLLVPDVVLVHHESASRGRDDRGEKQARAEREARAFSERWLHVLRDDPYYHPGLSLLRLDPQLG